MEVVDRCMLTAFKAAEWLKAVNDSSRNQYIEYMPLNLHGYLSEALDARKALTASLRDRHAGSVSGAVNHNTDGSRASDRTIEGLYGPLRITS